MQNATGSSTANLSNRRVRGTKPDGDGMTTETATPGTQRRANALEARRAAQARKPSSNLEPGKRTAAGAELDSAAADAPPRKQTTQTDKVAAIAELLRNGIDGSDAGVDAGGADREGADGAPADSGRENGDETEPATLETIAEALGVEVADLWEQVEFRDRDGNAHKLGALKDLLQEQVDLDARALEFNERKASDENDLLRQRQELDYILRSLPKSAVTPELVTRAKAERDRLVKLEHERTVEAIPEWRRAETAKAERAAIGQWMTQYGFSAQHVDGMFDHRMLKLLRDSWQRHENVKKALAKVKEQRGEGATQPARAANGQRRAPAPKLGANATRTEKVAAVAHLLRNGV